MAEYREGMVTVIIPCYNGEEFLAAAVQSALDQTYEVIELIVVNDGSRDASAEVMKPFLSDSRVRYLEHQHNRGIAAARNIGIRAARGEFVAFLDQDDVWLPRKVEKQVQVFREDDSEIGLVFSDVTYKYEEDYRGEVCVPASVPPRIDAMTREQVLEKLFLRNFVQCITVMMPRWALEECGPLDENVRGGADDHELFLRVAGRRRIYFLGEALAVKRMHGFNYTDPVRMKKDQFYIAEKMIGLYPSLKALRRKKKAIVYESLGYHHCRTGDYPAAVRFYLKTVGLRPLDVANWLKLAGTLLGLAAGQRAQEAWFATGRKVLEGAARLAGRESKEIVPDEVGRIR